MQSRSWMTLSLTDRETIDRVLLLCQVSWEVWCDVVQRWRPCLGIAGSLKHMFVMWMGVAVPARFMHNVWKSLFFAVVWSLWKARNDLIFGGQVFQLQHILFHIKFWVGCWIDL